MTDWEFSEQAKICLDGIKTQIEKNTPEIANIASSNVSEAIANKPLAGSPPLSEKAKRELQETIKVLLMKNVTGNSDADNSLGPIGAVVQATVNTALGKWLSDGLLRQYNRCMADFPGIKPKTPDTSPLLANPSPSASQSRP